MSRQRLVNRGTDDYFSAPREVVGPDGNRYDATVGTFELVQNWDTLTRLTTFSGLLDCSVQVSQQLQHRKVYIGCAIDDWESYFLSARVEFLLNASVVATIPLNRSFPPPEQDGPAGIDKITLVPATILDRAVITTQLATEVPNAPCPFIQNELLTNFLYNNGTDDNEYWCRISPIHIHGMFTKIQVVIDRWTATNNAASFGLATFILGCISTRYPSGS